ncbi:WD40 repeat domain-containing serine/threonine-protein kinase [Prosthecobacter sp.]|uniref:WD40 repeat domain-containing serine/threonine-protein kinase n=1 Tax=Prosthecobacter sp. TaxID=1965333 RepID=UPI0025FFB2F2|nr:WD40 repeat domain-containing serine/threonine-protein kinase [Prosthecobacter sp.]
MRRRIEERIAAREENEPAPDDSPQDAETKETVHMTHGEEPLEKIGRYKLLKQIGAGGFGTVWQAEQEGPIPRRVALKVVKLGMDTRGVIAQFEAERQLLALMDHPNIAKVFDAGATEDGLPYFVMELVDGVPLTRFCEHRHLSTRERLRLFVLVCQALQHAHQKGVIHRDIKPSNVLVSDKEGIALPKVIDFGIARAICPVFDGASVRSSCAQIIGTPAYMSPEQASGDTDIDTRCDVYALGVLLYELLTGRPPFDQQRLAEADSDEVQRLICEEAPPKPSSMVMSLGKEFAAKHAERQQTTLSGLLSELREDLDWIAMKAMEKDRNLRYETANGLAMDVERHLIGEFVRAHPDSRMYRLRKLVNRNKLVYTMGTLVAVALLVGVSLSATQASRATVAEHKQSQLRDLAERNGRKAYEEKEAARRALAMAQIALADAAFRDRDGTAMQAALHEVPEDLRDSSWRYLNEKSDMSVATIQIPGEWAVQCVQPHPTQAGVFIVASTDYWVTVTGIDKQTVPLRFQLGFEDHSSPDLCMTVSPDGKRLAAARLGGDEIVIHSLEDGQFIDRWPGPHTDALLYSPDGRRLLQITRGGPTCMRNSESGVILWSAEGEDSLQRAVFDRTGRNVIGYKAGKGNKLQILNAFNGTVLKDLASPRARLACLSLSPDGRQLLTGDTRGFVRCINLWDGAFRYEFRADDRAICALASIPDGQRFISLSNLSGGRQSIQVWDAQTGIFLQALLNGSGGGRELCVHPLSKEIMVSGVNAKAWRLQGVGENLRLTARDVANTAFWNTDDQIFTHGASSGFDLTKIEKEGVLEEPVWQAGNKQARIVTTSADGSMAALAASSTDAADILLLRQERGRVIEVGKASAPGGLQFMHLDPKGERLMIRATGAFYVMDTISGKSTPISWDRSCTIREAVWVGPSRRIVALLTAKTTRGIPGAEDRLVIYEADSCECLNSVLNGSAINAIAVSADGSLIAEGGADRTVRLRDPITLAVRLELRVHDSPVMALAFHPSRPVLATASEDLTIKLWNLADGKLLEELNGPVGPPRQITFSPTGRRLACISSDRSLRVWDVERFLDPKASE